MKGTKAVLCPKCGALNRPTWEFCARCNESLEAATSVEESVGPATAAEDDAQASSAPANTIALAGILALVIVARRRGARSRQPARRARPDPSIFTMGTQPSELPTPAPVAEPGAGDYDAGRRALNSGDLAAAVERLADAAAADPTNAEFRNAYGHALWRSGDRDGALAAHAEAARLDPRLQMQYARSLDVAGRTADAVAQYQQILAKNPTSSTVLEDLGRLLFRSGDYRGAASHLQSRGPVAARRRRAAAGARLLARPGGRPRASRRGVSQGPREGPGRRDQPRAAGREPRGAGPEGRGRGGAAGGAARPPEAPLLQRQMGAVLEQSGRPRDAAAAYRAYAELAPNAPDAQTLLARAARLDAAGGRP